MEIFTDEIINMCSESIEVQKMWRPDPFVDHVVKKGGKTVGSLGVDNSNHYTFGRIPIKSLADLIWIPNIDQIYNLLGRHESAASLSQKIGLFGLTGTHNFCLNYPLALWLAYYMCAAHGKRWCRYGWLKNEEIPSTSAE